MSTKRPTNSDNGPSIRASTWIRVDRGIPDGATSKAQIYTARLTIDITERLRQKIKLSALMGGTTVAELLRAVLDEHFDPKELGK